MKIGLAGAQGTGKTSVLREFYRRFPEWNVVGSVAREYKALGFKINRDADPLSQLLTTVARINAEARYEGNVIGERTVVDHLAYTYYQQTNIWKGSTEGTAVILESIGLARQHVKTYDLVFYFPVYWTPKVDTDRDGDAEYQRAVDWYLHNLLDTLGVDYVTMKNESVNKRVETIARLIKD